MFYDKSPALSEPAACTRLEKQGRINYSVFQGCGSSFFFSFFGTSTGLQEAWFGVVISYTAQTRNPLKRATEEPI